MNYHKIVSTPAVAAAQPVTHLRPQTQPVAARVLKLALDVHLLQHVVAMQYDGSSPKPPQRFTPKDFLVWVEKQIAQGWQVISCYEAGPFGYGLHRQLTVLGVTNHVIRPRNWDDEHKRVKTDHTDALSMLTALDRFVAGNKHALALVRVPTEAEERARTESRLRQSLKKDLKRIAQRGRGLALQYGYRLKGCWYGVRLWPQLEIPDWLVKLLTPLQAAATALNQLLKKQTAQIESQSTQPRPKGLGKLTEQIITREVYVPNVSTTGGRCRATWDCVPANTVRASASNAGASPRPAIPGCAGRYVKRPGDWCASNPTTASAKSGGIKSSTPRPVPDGANS
jgi:transposase